MGIYRVHSNTGADLQSDFGVIGTTAARGVVLSEEDLRTLINTHGDSFQGVELNDDGSEKGAADFSSFLPEKATGPSRDELMAGTADENNSGGAQEVNTGEQTQPADVTQTENSNPENGSSGGVHGDTVKTDNEGRRQDEQNQHGEGEQPEH